MEQFNCPECNAVLKDWRGFSEKTDIDREKPFECTGLRCGKRFDEREILQNGGKNGK